MALVRVYGWPDRLKAVVEKHQNLPSKFGVSDCYLIADDAVEAVIGNRMFPDVEYTSELEAAKQLLSRGFKNVEEAFASKFETIHPAQTQRGDIGVIESDGAICGGFFSSNGFAARDTAQIMFYPISRVKSAFKVGR